MLTQSVSSEGMRCNFEEKRERERENNRPTVDGSEPLERWTIVSNDGGDDGGCDGVYDGI